MADYITVMSQADIPILTDMLQAQQKLLQRLHNELEAERESSASAANEALAVILRLQEEKAAIKMESEHYKRLVEEKMRHDEKSVVINEDIIYQKEMEVLALSYQVKAYYHKLLSFGCVNDLDTDNLLQKNETLVSDKVVPVLPMFNEVMDECSSNNSLEMNSADEIRVKNETRGEIHEKSLDIENIDSLASVSFVSDSEELIDEIKPPASLLNSSLLVDYRSSANSVYDVYEVPQIDPDLQKETDAKDEYDGLREGLVQVPCDDKLRQPNDIFATDCHIAVSERSTSNSASRPRLNQLERESEITEAESMRPAEVTNRVEEIKLLNEIKEQLNSLQDEIRRSKVKKRAIREETSLCLLSEAMIYFWI